MTTDNYKPCPFCGSQYVKLSFDTEYPDVWMIRCPRCNMTYIPDAKTKEQAIELWNRRV